ncbi:hypothetical protein Anas_12032, partial [Armadillidium nasatum]
LSRGTPKFYISRILGNIFNFLTSVNAASNFILYCVMSDRFRKTFIQMFCKQGSSERSFHTSFKAASFDSSQHGRSVRTSVTSTLGNRYPNATKNHYYDDEEETKRRKTCQKVWSEERNTETAFSLQESGCDFKTKDCQYEAETLPLK